MHSDSQKRRFAPFCLPVICDVPERPLSQSAYVRKGSSALGDEWPLSGSETSLTAFRRRSRREVGRITTLSGWSNRQGFNDRYPSGAAARRGHSRTATRPQRSVRVHTV